MNKINNRNRRVCQIATTIVMLLPVVFIVLTTIQFVQTVSTLTLLITGGVILSWRIWKFVLKLLWLFLQTGIFFYVIYLLIA